MRAPSDSLSSSITNQCHLWRGFVHSWNHLSSSKSSSCSSRAMTSHASTSWFMAMQVSCYHATRTWCTSVWTPVSTLASPASLEASWTTTTSTSTTGCRKRTAWSVNSPSNARTSVSYWPSPSRIWTLCAPSSVKLTWICLRTASRTCVERSKLSWKPSGIRTSTWTPTSCSQTRTSNMLRCSRICEAWVPGRMVAANRQSTSLSPFSSERSKRINLIWRSCQHHHQMRPSLRKSKIPPTKFLWNQVKKRTSPRRLKTIRECRRRSQAWKSRRRPHLGNRCSKEKAI